MPRINLDIAKRKAEHLEICCNRNYNVEMNITTGFEDILFVHKAAPEVNFEEISLKTKFLGHDFNYPIILSAATGGTEKAKRINEILAKVAEKMQIGLCSGSQRSVLDGKGDIESFNVIREYAPSIFVAANLGAVQLNYNYTIEHVKKAIDMIKANALIFHLNPLQEIIQPEGNWNFNNLITKISKICKAIKVPIIVKEIGSGIAYEEAEKLSQTGVAAVDVAGAGGTSWAKIESIRAKRNGLKSQHFIGELFGNWGIPTAFSTLEVALLKDKIEIISSGGIRNGLQAAKALAIGAKLVGIALPVIRLAASGKEKELIDWLTQFVQELKTAMFLVGARNVNELSKVPIVIVGNTAQWLQARGFELQSENDI